MCVPTSYMCIYVGTLILPSGRCPYLTSVLWIDRDLDGTSASMRVVLHAYLLMHIENIVFGLGASILGYECMQVSGSTGCTCMPWCPASGCMCTDYQPTGHPTYARTYFVHAFLPTCTCHLFAIVKRWPKRRVETLPAPYEPNNYISRPLSRISLIRPTTSHPSLLSTSQNWWLCCAYQHLCIPTQYSTAGSE